MAGIDILLDEGYLSLGVTKYIAWHPDTAPHISISGATGSGKTFLTKLLLAKIALHQPDAQLRICDFKGDSDFQFLNGCPRFHRFTECANGLQQFYDAFQARQSGRDQKRNMLILLFDEFASYCNSIEDKKALEAEKRKLSNLLMLGRSFCVHVIISQQRMDAAYFSTARDNFNLVIGLGNLSEESKNMMFHEYKDDMKTDRKRGTGYMLTNGAGLTPVQVPVITDSRKLNRVILNGVSR